ncbi:UNVERIFIED_CONTAM: Subtilisin-like protease SBT2.6 [Sesamum radiatum]|uniref:Subtilisin-like protease SBT2.6 n=1 Tax=Sesamum radiatum TaxID=300843 RepID=A0AAW2NN60_SESRA
MRNRELNGSFVILIFLAVLILGKAEIYIVTLEGEPVISYGGGVSGFEATAVDSDSDEKIDVTSELVISYAHHLEKRHDMLLDMLFDQGTYKKIYSYRHLINGFAVHLSPEQAEILGRAPGVKSVERDWKVRKLTTHTPQFLGLPTGVWPTGGGFDRAGEDIVIGFVDSGIYPHHPSFATHHSDPYGPVPKYRGKCEIDPNTKRDFCNGKIVELSILLKLLKLLVHLIQTLILILRLMVTDTEEYLFSPPLLPPFLVGRRLTCKEKLSFLDPSCFCSDFANVSFATTKLTLSIFISHTAAIAAGNNGIPVRMHGFEFGRASGMAPRARIAVYKALYRIFGGFVADVVAAIDQSSAATKTTYLNPFDATLLSAVKAGVFVVQAAGNGGPFAKTLLSYSPWIATVAAAVDDRRYKIILPWGMEKS